MPQILVSGGAGYIGSHTLVDLVNRGFDLICVDDFSNSSVKALRGVEKITGKKIVFYEGDICHQATLEQIFEKHNISATIHFAALKSVGESVEKPLTYYRTNLVGLINLLECHRKYGVKDFIFSSSCSVYGNADRLPVDENTPWKEAESPYGRTKQMCEHIIRDFADSVPDQSFVMLRYFNPAGAHDSIIIGEEAQNIPTNLIPVITEVAIGKRPQLLVFGSDYDTRDGSCIRDFIHIMDLARAHTLALEFLLKGKNKNQTEVFNLGSGQGTTILEAIEAFEEVSDQKLNYKLTDRRPGDVVAVYADHTKATKLLQWTPERGIKEIMDTAWKWQLKHP